MLPQLSRSRPPTRRRGWTCSSPGSMPTATTWPQHRDPARRHGIGLTAPRIVAERTIAQLERMLDDPDRERHRAVDGQGRLGRRPGARSATSIRDVVYPADAAFLEALRGDYLPLTREEPGLWSAPNGEALYRTAIRSWTTLDLDPEEVHRIGLEELETIEDERRDDLPGRRVRRRHRRVPRARSRPTRPTCRTPRTSSWPCHRGHRARPRRRAAVLRRPARAPACGVRPVEEFKEKDAPFAYYYPPTADGSRDGHLLRQRLRPADAHVHEARHDHLPRGGPGPPLPDHAGDGEPEPQHVPPARLPDGGRRVRGGLGPVQRAAGRRDGPVPLRGRAVRHARRPGLARRAARGRHRDARAALVAPAVDRPPQADRPLGDRRRHRDRPLHLLAGPGAHVQDRPARDRAAAGRADRARRRRLRYPHVPRRGAGHGSLPLATFARELPAWVVAPV